MTNADRSLEIPDLIDIDILQRIQDTFAKAMGVAAVTVDRQGRPVTETSNFTRICLMIRSTDGGLTRCQQCDAAGGRMAHQQQRPFAYKCAGGLMDAAAPIIIEGQYVGCILCGQVIPTEDSETYVQDVIRRNVRLGLPYDQVERAVREIEPLPRDRFNAAVEMLSLTANHIIEMGAANMAQSQLLQEAQERAALQTALQEAQLRALKAQINPHFLFNSLTLISYTALDERAPRTEEIAYSLSDLLRYSLRNVATTVELGEEIEMIEHYLAIQKIRLGDRLVHHIELDPALRRVEVPCMLLQPLVENAVVHAAEQLVRPVTITVRASQVPDGTLLEVIDDGPGMPPELVDAINSGMSFGNGDSLGLQIVLKRLYSEYGTVCAAYVESRPDHGTCVALKIPNSRETGTPVQPPEKMTTYSLQEVRAAGQFELLEPLEPMLSAWE